VPACQQGFYKESLENNSCTSCPVNSHTVEQGVRDIAECVCKPDFTQRWCLSSSSSFVNESSAANLSSEVISTNTTLSNTSLSNSSFSNTSFSNQSLPDTLGNNCVDLPAGTFKTPLGNWACVPCPADHYCPPASSAQRVCVDHTSSLPGSSSPHDCKCFDFFVLIESNNTYKCEECYADTYYCVA
jgi:hypothetical protein